MVPRCAFLNHVERSVRGLVAVQTENLGFAGGWKIVTYKCGEDYIRCNADAQLESVLRKCYQVQATLAPTNAKQAGRLQKWEKHSSNAIHKDKSAVRHSKGLGCPADRL